MQPKLTARQKEAMSKGISLPRAKETTANDILNNLDELNKEIGFELEEPEEELEEAPSREKMDAEIKRMEREAVKTIEERKKTMKAEFKELPQPELEDEEVTMKERLKDVLSKLKGAPSETTIEKWKAEFGQDGIYLTAFSDKEAYVFTYLKRSQLQAWKKAVALKAESDPSIDSEAFFKEKVVTSCILWPNAKNETFLYNSRAGLIDTMFELIMAHSAFLTLQQAMVITTAL